MKIEQQLAASQERVAMLEKLCGAAYQLAGVVGAPVRFLDAFSRHKYSDDLLPVSLGECDEFTGKLSVYDAALVAMLADYWIDNIPQEETSKEEYLAILELGGTMEGVK